MKRLLVVDARMSARRTFVTLAVAASVSLALTLGIQASAQEAPEDAPPQVASVVWDFRPGSVEALARESESMVHAEVVEVRAGEPLAADAAGHPEGDSIPTQRIVFDVVEQMDGQSLPEQFQLFKTGSESLHLENDPPYRVGERYVLFVREREGEAGTYLPVAPDGRLLEKANGELEPLIDGAVDEDFEGDTPAEAEREVQQETSQ